MYQVKAMIKQIFDENLKNLCLFISLSDHEKKQNQYFRFSDLLSQNYFLVFE